MVSDLTVKAQTGGFPIHDPCEVRDPVRYHAFRPNCAAVNHWGKDSYPFFTNSLGFRDDKVRDIPLTDTRPRILVLGDSFTEGKARWGDTYVGRIAEHFPQYDFLNAGMSNYSPSNYLNTTRMVLAKGIDIDEVIVFIDNSAVQLEAAFYHDIDDTGAVAGLGMEKHHPATSWYVKFRRKVAQHFALTSQIFRLFDWLQQPLVKLGYYHLPADYFGDPFDFEISAWTYRKVNESDAYPAGYAPLGVDGGIAKEEAKMTRSGSYSKAITYPLASSCHPIWRSSSTTRKTPGKSASGGNGVRVDVSALLPCFRRSLRLRNNVPVSSQDVGIANTSSLAITITMPLAMLSSPTLSLRISRKCRR